MHSPSWLTSPRQAAGEKHTRDWVITINPNRSLEFFLCKKSDYSRLCHRYSICMLTQYADFALFQDKMKANFSNDRFRINPNRSLEIFLCKKSDYSRLCHRYSICMLTQYADFALFQDKMKANFSNDRFRIKAESTPSVPHRRKESVLSVYGPNGLNVLFQPRGRGRRGWFVISGGRVTSASECPS